MTDFNPLQSESLGHWRTRLEGEEIPYCGECRVVGYLPGFDAAKAEEIKRKAQKRRLPDWSTGPVKMFVRSDVHK